MKLEREAKEPDIRLLMQLVVNTIFIYRFPINQDTVLDQQELVLRNPFDGTAGRK